MAPAAVVGDYHTAAAAALRTATDFGPLPSADPYMGSQVGAPVGMLPTCDPMDGSANGSGSKSVAVRVVSAAAV